MTVSSSPNYLVQYISTTNNGKSPFILGSNFKEYKHDSEPEMY